MVPPLQNPRVFHAHGSTQPQARRQADHPNIQCLPPLARFRIPVPAARFSPDCGIKEPTDKLGCDSYGSQTLRKPCPPAELRELARLGETPCLRQSKGIPREMRLARRLRDAGGTGTPPSLSYDNCIIVLLYLIQILH